jgi:hypothetical protein
MSSSSGPITPRRGKTDSSWMLNPKDEGIIFFETSVTIYLSTRRNTPEDF